MIPVREIESGRNMIKAQRRVLLLISTVLLLALTSVFTTDNCTASSVTIYVDDSNTDGPWNGTQDYPYRSIQDGINAASSGDTIYVLSGTYNENIYIDKPLSLIGIYTSSRPVINGQDTHKSTIEIMTDSVTVSSFKIRNIISDTYNGISCGKTQFLNLNVYYCNIEDCEITDAKWGIFIKGSYHNISSCDIYDNSENGITIVAGDYNTIYQNTLDNNLRGLCLQQLSDYNTIYDNKITDNSIYGIDIIQSYNNRVYHNHFTGNTQNARDIGSNEWDNDTEGNYWDDYTGVDEDGDGIGDSPYDILGGSNQDEYPLGYFKGLIIAYQPTIYPNPATSGNSVSFSGSGLDSDGYIDGYNWRSSIDGQLSTESEFISSSLSVGTHTIYFKVKDNEGTWSSEKTASLTINPSDGQDPDPSDPTENQEPTAYIDSITPNPAAYTQTVTFSGHGIDEDGYITEWKWTSNIDGVIGNEETFNISDLSLGTHTIYFQVRDNKSEWSRQVTESLIISLDPLNQPPIANAGGPYSGDVTDAITFDGSESYDEDGEIVEYLWDFGDETTGSGESVTHTYTSPDNYTTTLTVTDDDGSSSTDTTIVTVVQSSGQNGGSTGAAGFELGIPFPLIIVFEIVFIVVGISLFLFWIKRK